MIATIFWNCRGMGSPSSINALSSLVRKYSPENLFLSETKSNKAEIRRIQEKFRFDRSTCVEATGRAGGVALFWMENIDFQILSMDSHHIDGTVSEDNGVQWRLTGIYSWYEHSQKGRTWELINWLEEKIGSLGYWEETLIRYCRNLKNEVGRQVILTISVRSETILTKTASQSSILWGLLLLGGTTEILV